MTSYRLKPQILEFPTAVDPKQIPLSFVLSLVAVLAILPSFTLIKATLLALSVAHETV